jgi:hypothetical protein
MVNPANISLICSRLEDGPAMIKWEVCIVKDEYTYLIINVDNKVK